MAQLKSRFKPSLEPLEQRLAMSAASAAAAASLQVPPGDTLTVLKEFAAVYPSRLRDPRYLPEFDLNHNGIIAQNDGRLLIRALPPLTRKIPLRIRVAIAPEDAARDPHSVNSGGATYQRTPLVIGRTTPGALIFVGQGTTDLLLQSPAAVADASGEFTVRPTLYDGINNLDLQAVDHYGQQTLRAFPIRWLGFARFEDAHTQKK